MNKRALIGLAVVPIVLVGASFWARRRALQDTEEDFRQTIISSVSINSSLPTHKSLEVQLTEAGTAANVGEFKPNKLPTFLSDARFSGSRDEDKEISSKRYFSCVVAGNSSSPGIRFLLGVDRDEGFVWASGYSTASRFNNFSYDGLRFTPESCRALKKQIWRDFGPKLRALHIPPPR